MKAPKIIRLFALERDNRLSPRSIAHLVDERRGAIDYASARCLGFLEEKFAW